MFIFFKKIFFFIENILKRNPVRHLEFLGICMKSHGEFLVGAHKKSGELLFLPKTKHGFSYRGFEQGIVIDKKQRPVHTGRDIIHAQFSHIGTTFFMTYTLRHDAKKRIHIAASKDGLHFKERATVAQSGKASIVTLRNTTKNVLALICGTQNIAYYTSTNNGHSWKLQDANIFPDLSHENPSAFEYAINYKEHISINWSTEHLRRDKTYIRIHGLLADNPNLHHLLWKSEHGIWEIPLENEVRLLGVSYSGTHIAMYSTDFRKRINEIILPHPLSHVHQSVSRHTLKRHDNNPILTPHHTHAWEKEAVFNPAAIVDDEGVVHMLYRAIGSDGVSRVGHALSRDGYTFDERHPFPVYTAETAHQGGPKQYNPTIYPSGGSWGGCEDPRAVCIQDHVYMTYVAFGGWNSIRMALTSLPLSDLKKKQWNWKKPLLLSHPKETHKNWVLFPEKINGKFAILHGLSPKILVEYIDSLTHIPTYIHSERPPGPQIGRTDSWDNLLRGAGPPPLKVPQGWLLFYHAIDTREPYRYKVGAMILDSNDPTRILYRSDEPILTPDMHYENDGKPGVVYTSGAVIKDGTLFIYYGGGDKVTCVASADLTEFLKALIEGRPFTGIMHPVEFIR